MQVKEVLLVLTDRWADWEASYAVAEINSVSRYVVRTIAVDKKPKITIGGIRAEVDYTIDNYDTFDNIAMVILPGGFSWQENFYNEIAAFLKKVWERHIPIAAICGATIFPGKQGFLDDVRHTGDDLEYFEIQDGYHGKVNYAPAQCIVDKGFITANETAAVDFAYEIFKILKIDTDEEIDQWFDKFKNGMVR